MLITCQAAQSARQLIMKQVPSIYQLLKHLIDHCLSDVLLCLASHCQPLCKQVVPSTCQASTSQLARSTKQMEITWRNSWCSDRYESPRLRPCCKYLAFSEQEFNGWLKLVLPITIYMGAASLAWEILKALLRWVTQDKWNTDQLCPQHAENKPKEKSIKSIGISLNQGQPLQIPSYHTSIQVCYMSKDLNHITYRNYGGLCKVVFSPRFCLNLRYYTTSGNQPQTKTSQWIFFKFQFSGNWAWYGEEIFCNIWCCVIWCHRCNNVCHKPG